MSEWDLTLLDAMLDFEEITRTLENEDQAEDRIPNEPFPHLDDVPPPPSNVDADDLNVDEEFNSEEQNCSSVFSIVSPGSLNHPVGKCQAIRVPTAHPLIPTTAATKTHPYVRGIQIPPSVSVTDVKVEVIDGQQIVMMKIINLEDNSDVNNDSFEEKDKAPVGSPETDIAQFSGNASGPMNTNTPVETEDLDDDKEEIVLHGLTFPKAAVDKVVSGLGVDYKVLEDAVTELDCKAERLIPVGKGLVLRTFTHEDKMTKAVCSRARKGNNGDRFKKLSEEEKNKIFDAISFLENYLPLEERGRWSAKEMEIKLFTETFSHYRQPHKRRTLIPGVENEEQIVEQSCDEDEREEEMDDQGELDLALQLVDTLKQRNSKLRKTVKNRRLRDARSGVYSRRVQYQSEGTLAKKSCLKPAKQVSKDIDTKGDKA